MADHEPSLEDCPTEILLKILSYVGFSDIHQNFARTCKRFYEITRNPPKLYVLNLSMDGDGHANFNRELLKLHKDVKRVDVSMCNQEYLARWMQDNDGVHGRILQAGYYKHFTQIGHILDKLEHLSVKGTLNYLHPDKLRHLKSLDMSNCPYPTCSTQRTERGLESWLVKSLAQCHLLEDVRLNRVHIRTLADLSIRLMTRLKTLKVVQFYDDVNSLPHHEIISYYPDLFRTNRVSAFGQIWRLVQNIVQCPSILQVRAAFYELGFFPFDPWSDKRHWKQLRDRIQTTLWTTLSDYCQLLTDVHLPYSEDCFITLSKLPNLTKVGINFRPYDWTQYNTYGRIAPDQRLKFKSQVIQQMTFHSNLLSLKSLRLVLNLSIFCPIQMLTRTSWKRTLTGPVGARTR